MDRNVCGKEYKWTGIDVERNINVQKQVWKGKYMDRKRINLGRTQEILMKYQTPSLLSINQSINQSISENKHISLVFQSHSGAQAYIWGGGARGTNPHAQLSEEKLSGRGHKNVPLMPNIVNCRLLCRLTIQQFPLYKRQGSIN